MGYLTAYDTFTQAGDLSEALSIHFSSNCYPPVPQYMVAVAVEAIENVLNEEDSAPIDLPEGVTWRGERTVRSLSAIESLHLEAFVDALLDGEYADEDQ